MAERSFRRNGSGIVMIFIITIIGLGLTPTISEQVANVTGIGGNNLTGSALAIAYLIPLFWIILILAIGIASLLVWLR